MAKKVLIISASLRNNSNSEAMARAFQRGAQEAGNEAELVSLRGKQYGFCRGCLACQKKQDGHCVMPDDADEIVQKMRSADVLVFATPIYYYEMSGQLKTLLDRANPLYPVDYRFRAVYVLTCAADDAEATPERAVHGVEGWIACFEHASLAGTVFAGGVNDAGEITDHPALQTAYEMGKNI